MCSTEPNVVELLDDFRQRSSDIWIRKMMTYFRMYDLDQDWVIHKHDIIGHMTEAAEGVVQSEKVQSLVQPMRQMIWESIWAPAGVERSGQLVVTLRSFLESRIELAFHDTEHDKKNMIFILDSYFQICDENGDGVISKEEYFHVLSMYGIVRYGITVSFASLDKNGNGQISWMELRNSFIDFYYSKHYGPELLLWGPIVETAVRYLKNEPPVEVPEAILAKSSDIWVRKMLTYFRVYDRKHTWVVKEADVIGRMNSKTARDFSKEKLTKYLESRKKVWESVWLPAAQMLDGEQVVTLQSWMRCMVEMVNSSRGTTATAADPTALTNRLFDLLDIDHDGQISKEEFLTYYSLFGMTKYAMTVAFNSFDTDMDGSISRAELAEGLMLLFSSFKYDQGVLAFGPICSVKVIYVPEPPMDVPESILKGTSEMWVRRMMTYFRAYDSNCAGTTTATDITAVTRRRAAQLVSTLSEEKLQKLATLRQKVWDTIWSDVAVEEQGEKLVTWERFIQTHFRKVTGPERDNYAKKFGDILDTTLEICDADENQKLDMKEHCRLLSFYGVNSYGARVAFRATDIDCDGFITHAEFRRTGIEFFLELGWGCSGDLFAGPVCSAVINTVVGK